MEKERKTDREKNNIMFVCCEVLLWNSQKLLDQVSYLHCSGYLLTQHLTKNTSSLFSFSLSPSLLPTLSFSLSFCLFDFVLFISSFVILILDWNEGFSIILQFSLVLCLWHNTVFPSFIPSRVILQLVYPAKIE